jgi:hypothetical protein
MKSSSDKVFKIAIGRYSAVTDQICVICKKKIQSGDDIVVAGDWIDIETKQILVEPYYTKWMHLQCFLSHNQFFIHQFIEHLLKKYITPETYENVMKEFEIFIMASKIGKKENETSY